MKLGIVIAAYNEGATIGEVLAKLPHTISGVSQIIPIVVNDGSGDNTAEVVSEFPRVHLLNHVINRGQGAALRTGFEYAIRQGYDLVVTFDADGQHSSKEITEIIKPIREGRADVVLGSRFLGKKAQNLPMSRRLVLKTGVIFTRVLSQIRVTDTHNGFRAFRLGALAKLNLYQDRMEHASEILDEISRQHLTYVEVPVTIHYTDYSKAKGQRSSAAFKMALKLLFYKLAR